MRHNHDGFLRIYRTIKIYENINLVHKSPRLWVNFHQNINVNLECPRKSQMSEKWVGQLLQIFLEAFDSSAHGLIIAKSRAYRFSLEVLKYLLWKRYQRTNINKSSFIHGINYSVACQKGLRQIPLFLMFLSNLFFVLKKIHFASYTGKTWGKAFLDVETHQIVTTANWKTILRI